MNSRQRVLTALRRTGKARSRPLRDQLGRVHAFADGRSTGRRRARTVAPDEYFDFDTRSVDLNPTRKTGRLRPLLRRARCRRM